MQQEKFSLQIQSVLYDNDKDYIYRSIESLKRSIELNKLNGRFGKVNLVYGDASGIPIFTEEEIIKIKEDSKFHFEFSYVFFNENTGYGLGNNMLSKTYEGDYIFIINPDVLCAPNLFIELFKPFENRKMKVGIVESRQVPIEHPKEYDRITGETSWASGAGIMIPNKIFKKLNGFDSNTFFMYCEDVDLSWRVRLLGYKIIYQPSAMIFHSKKLSEQEGGWCPTDTEKYYSAESALLMAHKWSNLSKLQEIINYFNTSNNEFEIMALESFIKRKEEGRLTEPLDPRHKVAEFWGNCYTKHRFFM